MKRASLPKKDFAQPKDSAAKTTVKRSSFGPVTAHQPTPDPIPAAPPGADRPLTPAAILHLQRTIGNRATQRVISASSARNAFIQRDLDFDNTKWTKAKKINRAGGGQNPVFIVDNLVIKGLNAGAAQQQFASELYTDMVQGARTRAVQLASTEGQAIAQLIKDKLGYDITKSEMIVMEKVDLKSVEDFAAELLPTTGSTKSNDGLRNPKKEAKDPNSFDSFVTNIFDSSFFEDMGKIHAMDMFLGNADRMDRDGDIAMQNIFINFSKGPNQYGALGLDLEVQAASLDLITKKKDYAGKKKTPTYKPLQAIAANKYKDWVQHAIKGTWSARDMENVSDPTDVVSVEFGQMEGSQNMSSTDVSGLFDAAKISKAINLFRQSLERWFPKPANGANPTNESERRGDLIGTPWYTSVGWPTALAKFQSGIQAGITQILQGMLPGGVYEKRYNASLGGQQAEEVFDFAVLKIRAKYMEMKQNPVPGQTEATIITALEAYAKALAEGDLSVKDELVTAGLKRNKGGRLPLVS